MSDSLVSTLGIEVWKFVQPLAASAEDPAYLRRLLASIGVTPSEVELAAIILVLEDFGALATRVEALLDESDFTFESARELLDISRQAFDAIRGLEKFSADTPELAGVGKDLADRLLGSYLNSHPLLRGVAELLTLIERSDGLPPRPAVVVGNEIKRQEFILDRFHFERLGTLLRDPVDTLRAEYDNPLATVADANAMADKLFPRVARVLRALGATCRYGVDPDNLRAVGDAAPFLDHALIVYFADKLGGAPAEAGVVLMISSADRGDLGLVVRPFGTLAVQRSLGSWTLDAAVSAGLNVVAYGHQGVTLIGNGASRFDATVRATLTEDPKAPGPAWVLGSPTGTRLELGSVSVNGGASLGPDGASFSLGADVAKSALVLAADEGDSFLSSILPKGGVRAEFALGLAWSNTTGLHLHGSGGFEATLPVSASLAGLSLSKLYLALHANDDQVTTEVAASLAASIGPVHAVLDRVGLQAAVTFPASGGNLGPANLSLGFKGPSGIGVTVDAHGVVSGGGFLFHDEAQGLYAGALQLSLHEQLTLKAYGLIATRMPDGSAGYSMLIFITAEDFKPIQLGLGFTLLGIGGMVAINRTFDVDVLRQGLQNDTLATLLFPRDPVGNAPALIQALASAFPARRGSYLLGLLAKIGWFTPTLVMLDLALILEFGGRTRLLALGRISARLPSADNDLVRLNLDAMGVIDFDAETVAIDAVLVDSRLVHKFVISGAGALRAGFGSGPDSTFVLSMGGLHPHFAPPAVFPRLERLTMALSNGSNPRIVCESYFAITANTLQFGARASLYAAAAGFSIEGDIGYDVLIQLSPLHFIADFDARLQLKRGSSSLFMVEVAGELEGPRPLRLSGKATFKIWFVHFSVRFDATLIDGELPPPPPAIDVFALLSSALLAPENWSTRNVNDAAHGVALRTLPTSSGKDLLLDPLGQLTIKQQVVPLNTGADLDLFGGAPVSGFKRFAISASSANAALESAPVNAPFAPAQYFNMSDDEKLAAPSFEMMQAGCVFGSAATQFDERKEGLLGAPLNYNTIVIGEDPAAAAPRLASMPPVTAYIMSAQKLQSFSRSGSVARASLRRVSRARFRNAAAPAPAAINPKRWNIIPRATGAAATLAPQVRSWSEYHAALKSLNRDAARWQLVPAHEMEL
jgi:hypothetical protein